MRFILKFIGFSNKFFLLCFSNTKFDKYFGKKSYIISPFDPTLKLLYNASDVFLVPSLQENLSNSIMESMSCGLPVVAFDTGGNSDLIEHSINGYLAKKYETVDFANGIMELLNDEIREEYSSKARQFILDNFDYKIVANKYNDLYNYILNKDASE